MEIILMILAASYMVGGKHSKDTSLAAYRAGKEPPGLVKARLRHEAGGGRFVTRPGKDKQPKGPGATRLLIASRWANACHKSKIRGEDKLKRWQAWYDERSPHRDKAWRDKQQRKIERRADRLDRWQGRWTATKDAAKNAVSRRSDEDTDAVTDEAQQPDAVSTDTVPEQPGPHQQPAQTDKPLKIEFPTVDAAEGLKNSPQRPWPERPSATESAQVLQESNQAAKAADTTTHTSEQGGAVYESGASEMHNHADEVDGYEKALTGLGQDMQTVGWGAVVHAPLADMHTKLQSVSGRYRNLAETVKHQGDTVNDAYDEAPWSPDRDVLTQ